MRATVALVPLLVLASAGLQAQDLPPNLEDPPCPLAAPLELGKCAAQGLLPGRNGKLAMIACVVKTINEWQHEQLRCLEDHIEDRASKIIYPLKQVLAPVNMGLRTINSLREEVEKLACGWRFSSRTELLEGVYLRQVKLCRPSFQSIFGNYDGYFTAPFHELTAWASSTSKNLIAQRTGLEGDLGPEATWLYTATPDEEMPSPGEAIRLTSTRLADRLRAKNSTLDMQAQRLLVGELLHAWRAMKKENEDRLNWFLTTSVASWKAPCDPLEESCP